MLSKGIKLSYKATTASTYTELENLQEIPDLGGDVDTVETTTLANSNRTYIPGLKDFGELTFTFLYTKAGFKEAKDIEDSGVEYDWLIEIPQPASTATDISFGFQGKAQASINGVGAGDAITHNLTITLSSDMGTTYAA